MIAVDTQIRIYAHRKDSPFHMAALAAMDSLTTEGEWAIPWPCIHEFIAVTTNLRNFQPPSQLAAAISQASSWLESGVSVLSESPTHFDTLSRLLRESGVTGGRVHDARIAAICIDHNVTELWTADRDFSHFTGLAIRNPLVNS